jgi:hypothetical protein
MTRYLLVRAASFHLLIDAALVEAVGDAPIPGAVDVNRALGGGTASAFVTLGGAARTRQVGVDAVRGLIDLAEADLTPLPALIAAAAGEDIDAVTLERFPFAPAHGPGSNSLSDRMIHRSGDSTCADHALGTHDRARAFRLRLYRSDTEATS